MAVLRMRIPRTYDKKQKLTWLHSSVFISRSQKNKSNVGKIFILRSGTSKNADLGGIFPAKAKLMPLYYIPAKNLKAENSSPSLQ